MKIKSHTSADHHAQPNKKKKEETKRGAYVLYLANEKQWGKKNLCSFDACTDGVCVFAIEASIGTDAVVQVEGYKTHKANRCAWIQTRNLLNWMCANIRIRVSRGNVAVRAVETWIPHSTGDSTCTHTGRASNKKQHKRRGKRKKHKQIAGNTPAHAKPTRAYYVANENYLGVST